MPKVSRVGKFREKASSTRNSVIHLSKLGEPNQNETTTTNDNDNNKKEKNDSLSRGQRKRQAKREQYLKREKMVMSSLRLKRLENQKGKLDGMDSMKEALITVAKVQPNNTDNNNTNKSVIKKENPTTTINTNRSKQSLTSTEVSHLGLVLQHPSFQSNPFATIQEHLKNTLADQAKELEMKAEKKRKENDDKAIQRKEARKERIRDANYRKHTKKGRRKN